MGGEGGKEKGIGGEGMDYVEEVGGDGGGGERSIVGKVTWSEERRVGDGIGEEGGVELGE